MNKKLISTVVLGALTALPVLGAAPAALPVHALNSSAGAGLSYNWSGYVDPASANQVSDVQAKWTVPAVSCSTGNQKSAIWVGIDGYTSSTIEQIGTEQDCVGSTASYYAWFQMYPAAAVKVTRMTVHPGDVMLGEVHYVGSGQFELSLQDQTTRGLVDVTRINTSAQRTSGEIIVEAPTASGSIQPLANFGKLSFSSAELTINGKVGTISSFAGYTALTMITSTGTTKALPSALSNGGASFSDSWQHQ